MAKLVVFRGTRPERYVDLTDRDLRLGRAPDNDVVLDDPDRTVSRFHAELRFENGRYTLIDLNSQNGLWMDGQRQPRVTLEPGRPVSIGTFRVLLQDDQAAAAPSDPTMYLTAATPVATGTAPVPVAAAPPPPAPAPPPPAPPRPAPAAAAPPPAPAPAPAKRAPLPRPQGEQVSLISKIARPKVMLSIIGVMVLLLVGRIMLDSGSEAPAQTDTTTTSTAPAETNEQRLARYVADARAKLNAGDYQGAIDAAQKALIVNQDSLEAIEVKTKAEEAARAAAAGTPPAPEASATQATAPSATGTQAQPPTPPAPPPSAASSRQPPAASQGASTASTQPARRRRSEPSEKKGRAERGPSPEVQQAYTRAKGALDRGRYADAVAGFEEVVKAEPGYQDAAALLAQARTGLKAQAAEAVRSGNQLAASGDIAGAREQYRRAQSMDPSAPGLSQAMASLTEQMREAGRQAYRRARQYDALGRAADAIPLYEQAVQYLPDSDPNRKVAQDRLTALRPR